MSRLASRLHRGYIEAKHRGVEAGAQSRQPYAHPRHSEVCPCAPRPARTAPGQLISRSRLRVLASARAVFALHSRSSVCPNQWLHEATCSFTKLLSCNEVLAPSLLIPDVRNWSPASGDHKIHIRTFHIPQMKKSISSSRAIAHPNRAPLALRRHSGRRRRGCSRRAVSGRHGLRAQVCEASLKGNLSHAFSYSSEALHVRRSSMLRPVRW